MIPHSEPFSTASSMILERLLWRYRSLKSAVSSSRLAISRARWASIALTTDSEIACPDPNCGAHFRVTRIGTREFRHSEVTATPLGEPEPE